MDLESAAPSSGGRVIKVAAESVSGSLSIGILKLGRRVRHHATPTIGKK